MTLDAILSELIRFNRPLSAHELSLSLRCSLSNILSVCHTNWWLLMPTTIDGKSGWYYMQRPVVNARKMMAREVKEYINIGITPSGPKGHIA